MKGEGKGTGLEALAGVGAPWGWVGNARHTPILTQENLENTWQSLPTVVIFANDRLCQREGGTLEVHGVRVPVVSEEGNGWGPEAVSEPGLQGNG